MDDFIEITDTSMLTPAEHPRDHNQPPLDELLREETTEIAARRDQLLDSVTRVPMLIADEATSGKVADLVRLITACRKTAETQRVGRKEPFLQAERLVDAHFKRITDPLDGAKREVEKRLTTYQRQKAEDERRAREAEARRQAEDAARQRREAEEAAAALETEADIDAAIAAEESAKQIAADAERARRAADAKAADLSRTRGDYGAVASLHTFWDFADLDRDTVDLGALRAHLPLDAIEKAVRAYIKAGGRELRGCTIFENTTTRVR